MWRHRQNARKHPWQQRRRRRRRRRWHQQRPHPLPCRDAPPACACGSPRRHAPPPAATAQAAGPLPPAPDWRAGGGSARRRQQQAAGQQGRQFGGECRAPELPRHPAGVEGRPDPAARRCAIAPSLHAAMCMSVGGGNGDWLGGGGGGRGGVASGSTRGAHRLHTLLISHCITCRIFSASMNNK